MRYEECREGTITIATAVTGKTKPYNDKHQKYFCWNEAWYRTSVRLYYCKYIEFENAQNDITVIKHKLSYII